MPFIHTVVTRKVSFCFNRLTSVPRLSERGHNSCCVQSSSLYSSSHLPGPFFVGAHTRFAPAVGSRTRPSEIRCQSSSLFFKIAIVAQPAALASHPQRHPDRLPLVGKGECFVDLGKRKSMRDDFVEWIDMLAAGEKVDRSWQDPRLVHRNATNRL